MEKNEGWFYRISECKSGQGMREVTIDLRLEEAEGLSSLQQ